MLVLQPRRETQSRTTRTTSTLTHTPCVFQFHHAIEGFRWPNLSPTTLSPLSLNTYEPTCCCWCKI